MQTSSAARALAIRAWDELHARHPLREIVDKWTDIFTQRYGNEPQRHYHNLNHIGELVEHYERFLLVGPPSSFADPDRTVLLSIFFHDIIYDGTQPFGHNEDQSADLFMSYCREMGGDWIKDETKVKVNEYILATKHHTKISMDHPDKALLYFLDFDLGILAASRERYVEYAAQIRQEYDHVPSPMFEEKRAAVLQQFLKVPRLYKTDHFYALWETRARENLTWEIDELMKKVRS